MDFRIHDALARQIGQELMPEKVWVDPLGYTGLFRVLFHDLPNSTRCKFALLHFPGGWAKTPISEGLALWGKRFLFFERCVGQAPMARMLLASSTQSTVFDSVRSSLCHRARH